MSEAPPLPFNWDGEAFVPASPYWARQADKYYTVGERYHLVTEHMRSDASHRQYFAAVNEAWANLPENIADHFRTPEHLRKHALIKAGYADSRQFVCASKAEALRLAAFMAPVDEYAIVTVSECVVTMWTAQSQSYKAMGRKAFNESKSKVLDIVAGMIGVSKMDMKGTEANENARPAKAVGER